MALNQESPVVSGDASIVKNRRQYATPPIRTHTLSLPHFTSARDFEMIMAKPLVSAWASCSLQHSTAGKLASYLAAEHFLIIISLRRTAVFGVCYLYANPS